MTRKIAKEIGLLAFSLLACLALAEAALHFLRPAPSFLRIEIHGPDADYELSPNRKLIYVPKPNTGERNAYGHRGREHRLEKGRGKRIVFIGDSVVEGYLVPHEKRFTSLLSRAFAEQGEIVNLAVRGYNLKQEVEYLKEKGLGFSPDHVIFGITYNDLVLHSGEIDYLDEMLRRHERGGFYIRYYRARSSLEGLLMKSGIYRHLAYFTASRPDRRFSQASQYRLGTEEVEGLIDEVKALSRTHGFGLTFVFLPVNTKLGQDQIELIKGAVRAADIAVVELDRWADSEAVLRDKAGLFVPNDPSHLSLRGHQTVADQLKDTVLEILR